MINDDANQIIENLYTAVLVIDNDLQLTKMNTAAENLLSMSSRKVSGMKLDQILPESQRFIDTIKRSLDSKIPYTERGITLPLPNEKNITIDCAVTPLMDNDQCHGVIVEMIDIHDHLRLVREVGLLQLHNAARESLRGIAHEIKNPLGGLRGAAQLLERELDDDELTEYTRIIINEADRLTNLVDRLVTPNTQINVSTVNVHEILEYVLNLIEAESESPLQVERFYDPSLPVLEADREQLIQAFLNILRNAVQAIAHGGHIWLNTRIKRMCTIRQELYKLAAQIEIVDDGPGVPQEIIDSMFYPMVTGRADGTGLGLSIAQSLVQSHRGIIEYERDDTKSIFRITLPIGTNND